MADFDKDSGEEIFPPIVVIDMANREGEERERDGKRRDENPRNQ